MASDPLTRRAQELRKNMTPQERHLWYDYLKQLPVTVNRQKILLGYIVEFYIPSCRLAIELDGSQHYEAKGLANDLVRDRHLRENGITVLRISNHDLQTGFTSVCEAIDLYIKKAIGGTHA